MREDARVYVMCHKLVDYEIPSNSLYEPIQAGAIGRTPLFETRDDSGDSISRLNDTLQEQTSIYWILKNHPKNLKYVGQCQYRRQLILPEDFDFDKAFETYDCITATPVKFGMSVERQYELCHNIDDLHLTEDILKEKYPEYSEDYDKYIKKGNTLFYSAGCVMKVDDYEKCFNFLFDILFEFLKRIGVDSNEDALAYTKANMDAGKYNPRYAKMDVAYQTRICGYLAERLMTVYFIHNFKNMMLINYRRMENTEI